MLTTNFDLVLNGIISTTNNMVNLLCTAIEKDTKFIFPTEDKINYLCPTFEIFAYNIFKVDLLAHLHQGRAVREALFEYCAARIQSVLEINGKTYSNILNKRMEEYGRLVRENKMSSNPFEQGLGGNFIQNLTYSVFMNKLFEWEGEIKPIPILDAMKCFGISVIVTESLFPIHEIFIIITKNLFTRSSDFTALSPAELEEIQMQNNTELREIGLI